MIHWRIEEITATNLFGFANLSHKFPVTGGLTAVVGSRGSGRSNGAGKSSFFSAVSWVIYGETPKSIPAHKVVRRGQTSAKGTAVIVVGDLRIELVRTRTKSGAQSFSVIGAPESALTGGTQAYVNSLLGDYAFACSTAFYFGASTSFCAMSEADRKARLEHLADVGAYVAAEKVADARKAEVASRKPLLQKAVDDATAIVSGLQEEEKQLATAEEERPKQLQQSIEILLEEIVAACEKRVEASSLVAEWRDVATDMAYQATQVKEEAKEEIDALSRKISIAQQEQAAATVAAANLRRERDSLNRELATAKQHGHPDKCPTCRQNWPKDANDEAHQQRLTEMAEEVTGFAAKIAAANTDCVAAGEKLTELANRQRGLLDRISAAAPVADHNELVNLLTDCAELDQAISEAQATRTIFQSQLLEVGTALPECRKRIASAVSRLESAKADLAKTERQITLAGFWKTGFGKAGLPSYLVDALVPDMQEVAATIASDLSDGELSLSFDPSARKSGRSVFGVVVDYAEGGDDLESVSTGESVRVDVATLFGIRAAVIERTGRECQQLFMDEVFHGTDPHFADRLVSVLKRRFSHLDILLISHDPILATYADRTVVVKKVDGISTVESRN